jgi:hypothetical protein
VILDRCLMSKEYQAAISERRRSRKREAGGMANKHLAAYLNDHLAGATMALELLSHLEQAEAGTERGAFFASLHADVTADTKELQSLMERAGISESGPRKAVAWFAEKVSQIKLRMEDRAEGAFSRLEALDILATGVHGKKALWCALEAAAAEAPEVQGVDYERLKQRADDQRQRIEERRLQAAKTAFEATS